MRASMPWARISWVADLVLATPYRRTSPALELASRKIELAARIESALEGMDEIDREIIAMRHFEDLRNCEVAELLGIKEAAASNRYIRALARFREVLETLTGLLDDD